LETIMRRINKIYRTESDLRFLDERRWVSNLIQEGRTEAAQNPMSAGEVLAESGRLARQGAERAMKLGVATDSRTVNTVIHERRRVRRGGQC
jgi:hypothetical protein